MLIVSVAEVPALTLAGLTEHVGARATVDCTVQDSVMEPLKASIAVVLIVDLAEEPGLTIAGVNADADTLKSGGGGFK